ncbi:amidase [Microbulbifer rhizosphaerae]|uniref:Aspartyl-tRNA(Asn)/glutamyl-tRNA(Gln) amidotransferase subunit A n=1 Tax=Microbulbifer rhizosphaerae TaxID=1562603 RepID=A0A7W4Z909_9GAMM|nr:amidase [Microbulbifer rhizosphaerae]MBB3061137.1 aspartyl-tRNA(Asn)/glutamyl-tRNA(Gln) amidotransferase subunit A [Microbulbifer rhizosphaerae]
MSDFVRMTAAELLTGYKDKSFSPVEVARAMLHQIERCNPAVNAYCLVDEETTLAFARESEQRYLAGEPKGKLDGVPVAIKDVFLTPMWPTLKGSKTVNPSSTLGKEAPTVAALARNGYVPLGKTTTPEFGWKGVTDNPIDGVTRNPWDTDKTAGGSSGGSAAAVPLGMGALALGTDAGGSIRIPAGFCGLVGLKPSFGEVPHWPPSPFGTLAHAGPMTWTVADCALLMNVLSEADDRDTNAIPRRHIDYLAAIAGEPRELLSGLRIAFSATLGYVHVDAEVESAVRKATHLLQSLGAEVTEVAPGFDDPLAAFGHLFYSGAANALRTIDKRQRALMDSQLVAVAEKASQLSMLDYLAAINERTALCERMAMFHRKYDLLLTPTLPITAFKAGREVPVDWPRTRWPSWTPYTYPFNLTGQPALSVPCGFSSDGLPIGLQLVGRRFEDVAVLRAGQAYQQAAPLTDRRPKLFYADAAAGGKA